MKKTCLDHCQGSASRQFFEMAKCFGKMAGLHTAAAEIADDESNKAAGDELRKSFHEASRDCHKSLAGECEKISGHHADRAQHFLDLHKSISAMSDADIPRNATAMGSTDFRPGNKALGGDQGEDILEMLQKLDRRLDQVVPDGVHAIAPTDNLRLVGRPGGPTVEFPMHRSMWNSQRRFRSIKPFPTPARRAVRWTSGSARPSAPGMSEGSPRARVTGRPRRQRSEPWSRRTTIERCENARRIRDQQRISPLNGSNSLA